MLPFLLSALAAPPPCFGPRFSESFAEYVPGGGAVVTIVGCGTGATQSCTGGLSVIFPGPILHNGQQLTIASPAVPSPGAYSCTVHTHQGGDSVIVVVVGL